VKYTPNPGYRALREAAANGFRSQGAAVMHSTVGALPEDVKKATIAGVLFGSTKNKQDEAQIRNYPKDQVVSYCTQDDGVCWGRLEVTGGKICLSGFSVNKTVPDSLTRSSGVSYQWRREKGRAVLAVEDRRCA
jgi:hypothetical protein